MTMTSPNERLRVIRSYHTVVGETGVNGTGPYPEAVEQYTQAIALNPNDAKVGYGLPRLCSLASSFLLE